MKTLTMIMTLATGLATFGLAASAENATKEPARETTHTVQTSVPTMSGMSAFVPASEGKQPAWVAYGSMRQ